MVSSVTISKRVHANGDADKSPRFQSAAPVGNDGPQVNWIRTTLVSAFHISGSFLIFSIFLLGVLSFFRVIGYFRQEFFIVFKFWLVGVALSVVVS